MIYIAIAAQTVAQGQDNSVFNFTFKQDFSSRTAGLYNISQWRRDWNNPAYENGLDKTYIMDAGGGTKPCSGIIPKAVSVLAGGGQFESPNNANADEIYMSYNIQFKPGFDWVLGGKLPGLTGGPHSYYTGVPNRPGVMGFPMV